MIFFCASFFVSFHFGSNQPVPHCAPIKAQSRNKSSTNERAKRRNQICVLWKRSSFINNARFPLRFYFTSLTEHLTWNIENDRKGISEFSGVLGNQSRESQSSWTQNFPFRVWFDLNLQHALSKSWKPNALVDVFLIYFSSLTCVQPLHSHMSADVSATL